MPEATWFGFSIVAFPRTVAGSNTVSRRLRPLRAPPGPSWRAAPHSAGAPSSCRACARAACGDPWRSGGQLKSMPRPWDANSPAVPAGSPRQWYRCVRPTAESARIGGTHPGGILPAEDAMTTDHGRTTAWAHVPARGSGIVDGLNTGATQIRSTMPSSSNHSGLITEGAGDGATDTRPTSIGTTGS